MQLEQEFEHAELKAHEACRRMEALTTELEYSQTEEARREEGNRLWGILNLQIYSNQRRNNKH